MFSVMIRGGGRGPRVGERVGGGGKRFQGDEAI